MKTKTTRMNTILYYWGIGKENGSMGTCTVEFVGQWHRRSDFHGAAFSSGGLASVYSASRWMGWESVTSGQVPVYDGWVDEHCIFPWISSYYK